MSTPAGADPLEVALPYPDPPVAGPTTDAADPRGVGAVGTDPRAAVTVSEEHLLVGTEWVVSGRVRVRRRIVTEYRTIEVAVRREVVELGGDTVDFRDGRLVGVDLGGPAVPPPDPTVAAAPFVAVLREEVPVVTLQVRPYEQLTVTSLRVQDVEAVRDTVRHEHVDITIHPPATPEEN